MPELKLNFAQAKMNKDLDERIIPSGQYRDATNIQISTSDGSDVGSAQTLMGNTKIMDMFDGTDLAVPQTGTVVATVASPETDRIYYFVSAGDKHNAVTYTDIQKDYIVEFNTDNQRFTYVFVDIYKTKKIIPANSATTYINVPAITASVNNTGIRIGMQIYGTATNNSGTTFTAPNGASVSNTATYQIYKHDNVTVTDIIWDSGNNRWKIYTSEVIAVSSSDVIYFEAPRVLKFYKNRPITGINILDGNIYWTDNNSEPKKINIERSIKGTGGTEYLVGGGIAGFASATTTSTYVPFTGDTDSFHTRLVKDVEGDGYLRVVTNPAKQKAVWVEESHVTVIKKGPTQPLELEMYRSITPRITTSGSENALVTTMTVSGTSVFDGAEAGDSINLTFDGVVDYREGDILYFIDSTEYTTSLTPNFDVQAASVRVQITTSNVSDPDNLTASGFVGQILSIEDDVSVDEITWNVRRDAGEALFEFQFPRFSYRYKYQDGEYSTFAPWSEVAFLPDLYEYFPKKGFNLGMRNQLRSLKLKYYFYPLDIMPQDVVEIDILYKETNNPTVYTVKTIKPSDEHPMWPDLQAFPNDRGEFEVKTDLIHAVVPSNQLLRPWDNVPKRALAQEVSANRIIYANYVQNYDVLKDPIIQVSLHQNTDVQLDNDNYALPSVKSLRKYQVGVVFSDGYGRETPVLTSKEAMINVPKSACNKRNRINARLKSNTNIPYWAKYYSFYMKEISSEYYTLAMDRWYQ